MERYEENISHDERQVADLVGTLRRIEAPGDFEARVRARIAAGRPTVSGSTWRPVLAGVAALLIAVAGLYFALRPRPSIASQDVAVTDPAPAADQPVVPAPPVPAPSSQTVAVEKPVNSGQPPQTAPGGGSVDQASREGQKFYPRGVDPRTANVADTRGVDRKAEIPLSTILGAIGIDAKWNGSGWHVDSVTTGNLAERAGVRAGDVIEAIDGRAVDDKTVFTGSFSAKSLRVRRDGAAVEIPFKP